MSQLRRLTPKKLARLLRIYRGLVMPGEEAPHYHVKRFRFGWLAAKWRDGTLRRLDNETLYRHLLGTIIVGARWHLTDMVSCVVFDIDADRTASSTRRGARSMPSVHDRFDAIREALAPAEIQAVRSSRSGGVHAYLFLIDAHEGTEVRSVVIDRLRAAGLKVRPGVLEVWPSNQVLRLPLGQGSHLLAHDLTICAAVKSGKVFRDVPASIVHLASFKHDHAVSLDSLRVNTGPSPRVDQCSSKVRKRSANRVHGSSHGNDDTEVSFKEDIEASHGGVSEYGARYRQASRRVYWLRVTCGLSPEDTMKEFERWLLDGSHVSKDLESPRRHDVIRRMLRDAARYVEHLEREIARGSVTPGTGARVALSAMVEQLRGTHGKEWRDVARSALELKDLETVGRLSQNIRPSIEVMLGLLRLAASRTGTSQFEMSMAARTLQTIAGGRTRPVLDAQGVRVRQLAASAYKAVLRVLERVGVVSLVAGAEVGRRARIFLVTL